MLQYVTHDVLSVPVTGTLRDVIQTMATGVFRHLPVVDEGGALVGIISDRDVRSLLPRPGADPREVDRLIERTRVADVMTRDPITVDRDGSMLEAVELVLEHRIGSLPVLEDGQLVGIITQTDLLRAFAEHLGRSETIQIEETAPAYVDLPLSAEQHVPLLFLVEPAERLRRDLSATLTEAGFDLTSFASMDELTDHDGIETPDLILLSATANSRLDPLEILREGYPMTPVVVTRQGRPRGDEPRRGKGPLFLPCSAEALLGRVRGEIGFSRWTHDLPSLTAASLAMGTGTIDLDISVTRQVLVVDHDALTRRIIAYHLRRLGCEVTEADDARDAVEQLSKRTFDLITVELDVPYGSGLDVLAAAREHPTHPPRAVVVAGARREDDVVTAFSLGAADFIKKPLLPELLEARLLRALSE